MNKLTFECELITPMFMYGGDGKTLELRPSEFKGMLRFGWRALHPELSLDEMRKKEGEIFGDTDKKSSFRIKANLKQKNDSYKYYLLPHKNKANFPAFQPGDTLHVELILLNQKIKDLIKNLFILSSIIGGFRKRSRRGFGSIKINNINGENFNYEDHLLSEKMENLIKSINPNFSFWFQKDKDDYPYIKDIEIGNIVYNSYDEILKYIGQLTHDCRCGKAGVFKNVKRFASPCYISVIKKNDKYFPIITSLSIALQDDKNLTNSKINTINKFKKSILEKKNFCKKRNV